MQKNYTEGCFVSVRYGKENNVRDWRDVVSLSQEEGKEAIDKLLEQFNSNSHNNGFFSETDIVDCGQQRGFVLNDKELYYMFFENLRELYEKYKDQNFTNGNYINTAIKATIEQYAGGKGVDRDKRIKLTTRVLTDGDIKYPSIAMQKGQNCFYCTERAAISHNLWLLSGATSYFCLTDSDNFGQEEDVYKNDTHNFTIVAYDDRFILYDLAMDNFCQLPNDCIDNLLSGQGLQVTNVNNPHVKNPGIYAKNVNMIKEI